MTDKQLLTELVKKAKGGDSAALDQLFNSCYNDIYYFALKTIKNPDTAYDVTQEACIEIFNGLSSLENESAFTTWSKQITYRRCCRYFEKARDVLTEENDDGSTVFDTLEDDDMDFVPAEALDKEDFRKTIMEMINNLSEEQRTAVMLYYFDELSISEIAEIQGVSEGTVKSRLNYARKAIKSAVEDYEEKNDVKLHSFGLLPLLLWLKGGDMAGLSIPAASAALHGALASGLAASAGSTAASTVAATAASASKGIAAKIIAAVVAVSVAVTGGVVAYKHLNKEQNTTPTVNASQGNTIPDTTVAPIVIPEDFTSDMLVPYSYQHDFKSDFYKCLDSGARYFITQNGEVYNLISNATPIYTDVPIDGAYYLSNHISYVNDDGSVVLNFCDSIWTISSVRGEIIGFTVIGYAYADIISCENGIFYYTKYDLTTGDSIDGPYQVVLKTADGETADIARLDICYSLSMGFSGFYITSESSSYLATKRYVAEDGNPRFVLEAEPYCENVDTLITSDDLITMNSPVYSKVGDFTSLYFYNNQMFSHCEYEVPLPDGYTVSQIRQLIPTEGEWLFIFDDGSVYVTDSATHQSFEVEYLSQLNREGMILNFYFRSSNLASNEPLIIVHMADNGLYTYVGKE